MISRATDMDYFSQDNSQLNMIYLPSAGVRQNRVEDLARTHDDTAREPSADPHGGRPVPPGALLGLRHHPFHGVPPACGAQAVSRHASIHLRHLVADGDQVPATADGQAGVRKVSAEDSRRNGSD